MLEQEAKANLMRELQEIAPKLWERDLEETIFFARLLWGIRRTRRILPPTAHQWQCLPLWLRWKYYLEILFWDYLLRLQRKMSFLIHD